MSAEHVVGRVRVHPRGFGFLNLVDENAPVPSAFLAPPDVNRLLDGDLVRARLADAGNGRFNALEPELLERPRHTLFGEVVFRSGKWWLQPDSEVANTAWPLDRAGLELRAGDGVVARLEGERAVAERSVPAADRALERVIARHGLPQGFPADVEAAAQQATTRAHVSAGRRDLRDVPTVTIDGPSTRDIDDAVSVLPADADGALRILVSIADVAEFVTAGSPLDAAVAGRSTSVYLAGRVLPMLPESLSTAWLSLLPGQDRLCLTAELRVDPEGRVLATDVYESIIRSAARLTYDDVAEWLDHGTLRPVLEPVKGLLPWLRAADARLAVARAQRGGVVLERDEARVTYDARTGAISGLGLEPSTSAHLLIERFMVAANEAVAVWLQSRGVPVPYRVHDQPDATKVADLGALAEAFGLAAGFGRQLTPLAMSAFDRQIRGTAAEPALRSVLRRLLGTARYTGRPTPHFGLAAPLYLHFTSPIRRYADLLVHRAVKQYLRGQRDFAGLEPALEARCATINEHAARSARAETDRLHGVQAEVMSRRLGEVFPARITRVRPFGALVQLDGLGVEGLVPLDALPGGPLVVDARETTLRGAAVTYTVGVALNVKLVAADVAAGRLEFAPA